LDASIREIPELVALARRQGLVRIPPELDVPLTPRIRGLIDTPEFRRLARISQLGFVSLVYPAAHHRRFEHALGVYRLSLLYLQQLAQDARFQQVVTTHDADRLIAAALLHDIGHWPFCHTIEDLQLESVPRHEDLARYFLTQGELADQLARIWRIDGGQVADLLACDARDPASRLLGSILSGPIDVDKMDYLMRDSLHAGVPYGRNFDQARLISSLCLNESADGLALTEKGRTAAEMMVFARYVMFSEVYWHHAVRAATAMLQRVFFELHDQLPLWDLFRSHEREFIDHLRRAAGDGPLAPLLDGVFGTRRRLYKRWLQYTCYEHRELYQQVARQPYAWLRQCCVELASGLTRLLDRQVDSEQILLDAPPRKLEVQFDVSIQNSRTGDFRRLVELSPVVKTLAETQFDDHVKRVRVFVHPDLVVDLPRIANVDRLMQEAIDRTNG
jgi:HD superfamily phosphohydrolase